MCGIAVPICSLQWSTTTIADRTGVVLFFFHMFVIKNQAGPITNPWVVGAHVGSLLSTATLVKKKELEEPVYESCYPFLQNGMEREWKDE